MVTPKFPKPEFAITCRAALNRCMPLRDEEVEDFVDFLKTRDQDRALVQAAARLSENAFRKVWDNPDDAEYDRL